MNELLTNDEIDSLLAVFAAEGPPLEEAAAVDPTFAGRRVGQGPVVSEVDLLKPNRFTRDHIQALERLFQSTSKVLAAAMSDRLRIDMACDCVAVEQMRFSGWLKLVGSPCAIYVLQMPPFDMPVLFTSTTGLLYGAVDRILGGSGKLQELRSDFTAAEYIVADAFVGPCLDRITKSLTDLGQFSWTIENRYCNPSMAQIVPGQDVVLSVYFQVSSEHLLGDVRLVIPYTAIAPFLDGIEAGPGSVYRAAPGSSRDTTSRTVLEVPLDMSVILGTTQVALRQLLNMRVGDVVPLTTRVGEPLVAPVQGLPKFSGQVGTRGKQLAFQIGAVMPSAPGGTRA